MRPSAISTCRGWENSLEREEKRVNKADQAPSRWHPVKEGMTDKYKYTKCYAVLQIKVKEKGRERERDFALLYEGGTRKESCSLHSI